MPTKDSLKIKKAVKRFIPEGEEDRAFLAGLQPAFTIDCTQLTWQQMSILVYSIWVEMKRRNPIAINSYASTVKEAAELLDEISKGEARNFTSESGPKEPKRAEIKSRKQKK